MAKQKHAAVKEKTVLSKDKHAAEKDKTLLPKEKHAVSKDKASKAKDKVAKAHEKLDNNFLSQALPGGNNVWVGGTIRKVLKKLDLSTTDLALLLGISKQSTRAMLKKKYLHATRLVKISEVLNHDVVRYLYLPEELPGNKALKEKAEELEKENDELKEKIKMLEELNALLKKK